MILLRGKYRDEFDQRWAQIRDWYECDHEGRVEIRRRTLSNGRLALYEQCAHCGRVGRAVKKSGYSEAEMASMNAFDEALDETRRHERHDAYVRLYDEIGAKQEAEKVDESAEWWRRYTAYLQTPEWKRRRAAVLKRAGGVCEGCGSARAAHVHHLTYERVGEEMLFDLVAVCVGCHQRLHPDRVLEAAS